LTGVIVCQNNCTGHLTLLTNPFDPLYAADNLEICKGEWGSCFWSYGSVLMAIMVSCDKAVMLVVGDFVAIRLSPIGLIGFFASVI